MLAQNRLFGLLSTELRGKRGDEFNNKSRRRALGSASTSARGEINNLHGMHAARMRSARPDANRRISEYLIIINFSTYCQSIRLDRLFPSHRRGRLCVALGTISACDVNRRAPIARRNTFPRFWLDPPGSRIITSPEIFSPIFGRRRALAPKTFPFTKTAG